MKKELFIKVIEALEKQMQYDIAVSKKLSEAFPNAFSASLLPDNHILNNVLIEVLQVSMNDPAEGSPPYCSWIEHFCFELDFGKENFRLPVYDKDKNIIPMSTAGELYDFLVSNQ